MLMEDEICKIKFVALNGDNSEIFIGNIPTNYNNDGKLIENVANLVFRKKSKQALFVNFIEMFKTDSVISDVALKDNKYLTIRYTNGSYDLIEILENDIRITAGVSQSAPKNLRSVGAE